MTNKIATLKLKGQKEGREAFLENLHWFLYEKTKYEL